jgi:hypothetical protein
MPKKSREAGDDQVARTAGQSTGASSHSGRKYNAAWQFRTNQNGVYGPDATLTRPQPPPMDREDILERAHRRRPVHVTHARWCRRGVSQRQARLAACIE